MRGATWRSSGPTRFSGCDFNPRAPCGARPARPQISSASKTFQPTRPLRGATIISNLYFKKVVFQPTRPLRGATMPAGERQEDETFQPTRPLRGATLVLLSGKPSSNISTHAPLAGRDRASCRIFRAPIRFQPTRPLRGATISLWCSKMRRQNFNPRAPCGARRYADAGSGVLLHFNPRAPCGARQNSPKILFWRATNFNPRAPCGARQ